MADRSTMQLRVPKDYAAKALAILRGDEPEDHEDADFYEMGESVLLEEEDMAGGGTDRLDVLAALEVPFTAHCQGHYTYDGVVAYSDGSGRYRTWGCGIEGNRGLLVNGSGERIDDDEVSRLRQFAASYNWVDAALLAGTPLVPWLGASEIPEGAG